MPVPGRISRVLWQNEHYPDIVKGGGGARNTRHITSEFRRAGIDVEILARRTPEIPRETALVDGTTVRYYSRHPLAERFWIVRPLLNALLFQRHLRRYADARDLFFCIDPEFVFALKRLYPATPVICRVEGTRAGDRKSWLSDVGGAGAAIGERLVSRWMLWQDDAANRLAWRRADGLIVKSKLIQTELVTHYGIDAEKIRIIPNGVDFAHYAEAMAGREVTDEIRKPSPEDAVLCFVGRLSQVKNLHFLLAAFARLRSRQRAILLVVGDGELRPALERECDALGIRERVRFVGNKTDVAPYLAASDIFVLTSLYETIANCLLEAMSAGLCCVALRPDGAMVRTSSDEVILDGQSGRLVAHGSPEDLAVVLDSLLDDRAARIRLGKAGQRRVKEHYDWARCASQYIEFGRSLMAQRRTAG